jgi:ABC-type amino acid transport substrate-binding protein
VPIAQKAENRSSRRLALVLSLLCLVPGLSSADAGQVPSQVNQALSASLTVELDPDERAFLDSLGPVRMAVDPDWEPYEWVNSEGEYQGIASELLQLIALRLGHEFELVPTVDWSQSLAASKSGTAHILAFLNQTPARDEWLIFTAPYFSDPAVFITREDHEFIVDPGRLVGETIVLPAGTSMEERIRASYPDMRTQAAGRSDGCESRRSGRQDQP